MGRFFSMHLLKLTTLFLSLLLVAAGPTYAQDGDFGGSAPDGGSSGGSSGRSIITIEVYQEKDLDKTVRVEGDGSVALALIGKVKIGGMTVAEAQSLITDLYNRDYLVDPQISVLVTSFSPKIVHVLGSVNSPGVVEIPPDRDLTLTEAIAAVRGVSRLGNPKSITVKRVDSSGRAQQMDVNFTRIVTDPNVKDLVLKEGDTIWVPERII